MLILVPLFGLQQFFIIYRPQPSDQGFYVYEVCSAAIMNLQVRTFPEVRGQGLGSGDRLKKIPK